MKVIKCKNKPWFKIAINIVREIKAAPMHERFIIIRVDLYSHFPQVKLCGEVFKKFICTLWFSE